MLLTLPATARAADAAPDPAISRWQEADGPDAASILLIRPDGHFRYVLTEGALDENAEGRWQRDGASVRLYTEPTPTPPQFSVESMTPGGAAPLSIFIAGPDGKGVAGVEFRVEFDSGDPVEAYTQDNGWTGNPADKRVPRWVQLHEPIYNILSDRLPIPAGATALRFIVHPNDLGIADFRGTQVVVDGDRLTLHDVRMDRHYARVAE